jgi:hypothetical protein
VSKTPGPVVLPTPDAAEIDRGMRAFRKLKESHGLYSGGEILEHIDALPSTSAVVENLIAPGSVNLLVGDSGIGKSPLAYQMGLAAATETPFLGMPTQLSKVLYLDYENRKRDIRDILTRLCRHLGLTTVPPRFLLWPLAVDPARQTVEEVVDQFAPDLVIIDSLRTFSPEMETDSRKAVEQIKRLRAIAHENGTAFLMVHHLRKIKMGNDTLEEGNALDWLRRAAGVRALVNQTDSRLAFAKRKREDEIVLCGHVRTHGEVGPFLIRRHRDADGDPAGYARFEPVPGLIENAEQEAAFATLPDEFTFGEARATLGKGAATTNWFVQKLIRLGLVHKMERGQYRKVAPIQEIAA